MSRRPYVDTTSPTSAWQPSRVSVPPARRARGGALRAEPSGGGFGHRGIMAPAVLVGADIVDEDARAPQGEISGIGIAKSRCRKRFVTVRLLHHPRHGAGRHAQVKNLAMEMQFLGNRDELTQMSQINDGRSHSSPLEAAHRPHQPTKSRLAILYTNGRFPVERLTRTMSAAHARRDGANVWRNGEDARAAFRAVDGTVMVASALSPYDVVGLAAATGAPDVQFNLAMGVSSTRRRGEPASTKIIIDLAGADHGGQPLRTRHAIVHPEGQMPLTGLGVAMVLERPVGLDGDPATAPGLYFPYRLLDPATYLARLEQIGGRVLTLDPA